jgi:TolA-binding protein
MQNEESSALGSARQRIAAASPSARDSATSANRSTKPSAEAAAPAPLPAARLERRAREHIAAKRWPQAAADYRELLRRFPKDPQHAEWLKQLDLSERATTQPTPKD